MSALNDLIDGYFARHIDVLSGLLDLPAGTQPVHLYFLPQNMFDKFPVIVFSPSDPAGENTPARSARFDDMNRTWGRLPNLLPEDPFEDTENLYQSVYTALSFRFRDMLRVQKSMVVYFGYHDSDYADALN